MSQTTWSKAQRRLHWLIAGMMVLTLLLAWIMVALPDSQRLARFLAYQAHKNLGLAVFVASLIRLVVRLRRGRPDWPRQLSPRQRRQAGLGHGILHGLSLIVPVLGYGANSAAPAGIPVLLGLMVPLPALLAPSPGLYDLLRPAHVALALLLAVLALGHGMLAVHHHRRGMAVLRGMWTGRG